MVALSEEDGEAGVIYGDDYTDVTDNVTCYEKGKVIKCECGHKIGTTHRESVVQCAVCGKKCVDEEADEREAPDRDGGQSSLNQWL